MAELVASFTASVTTDISPWIPCSLAMCSAIMCLVLLAIMPDPRKSSHNSYGANSSEIVEEDINRSTTSPKTFSKSIAVDSLRSALSNRNIRLIIPVFLVGIFRYTTLNLLIQYASVRLGLKISTGATFYTETAIVNIFLFLFLVPRLTAYIRLKYNVRPQVIDLVLVRTSVTLMCLGCLAIGLSQARSFLPIGSFIPPNNISIYSPGDKVLFYSPQGSEVESQHCPSSRTGSPMMQKQHCMLRSQSLRV